jgi:hypothetical protein
MSATYQERKEQIRAIQAGQRLAAQDVGEIPRIYDPIRRRDCCADFELYCRTYHAGIFSKPWAQYQKNMAARVQSAVEYGGWRADAVPRAGGKTAICRAGILWAALSGRKKYPVVFAANEGLAEKLLRGIKMQLFSNPLLLEDFPHAIYPIRQLRNEARKAQGQKYHGNPTFVEWGSNRIVMPWIDEEPSLSNGVVVEVYGIESASRGLFFDTPTGQTLRPDLALADDPQTRASAKSPSQTITRLEHLTGDIAYLPGPGESMPVFCPCTVIYEGDLADRILNRELHPEWQGERVKMVESFPTNMDWWDKYAEVLRECQKQDKDLSEPTKLYVENREIADAGCVVSWVERFDDKKGEVSAIQHAMNLRIRNEAAFYSECQNEPIIQQDDLEMLSADEICAKVTGHARGVVPDDCSIVTAFTDIQGEHFFWMVCGWTPEFTGYVLDYGAWPDQKRSYFTRRDIRNKLSNNYAGDESGMIFAALSDLGSKLAGMRYPKASGGELSLARWCIDVGFRSTPVTAFAVQSEHRSIITLTKGVFVGASTNPFSEAERARKWRTTHGHWFWADGPGPAKAVRFDANHWKKRIHLALRQTTGSAGSIQLFKAPPQRHRMIADHLTSEKATRVTARGRTVDQFDEIPGRDNEGLDCLVGCALGASIAGLVPAAERIHKPRTKIKTPDEWKAAARAGG